MILKADQVAKELESPGNPRDPLIIRPNPSLIDLKESGSASIDLRLGCWFQVFRQSRLPYLDVYEQHADIPSESKLTKRYYVPFGAPFILHPKSFVLAVTLEWLRFPNNIAGYVVGLSSGKAWLNNSYCHRRSPRIYWLLDSRTHQCGRCPNHHQAWNNYLPNFSTYCSGRRS